MSAISHSTRFSPSRPTRSPGSMPASTRAAARGQRVGAVVGPGQVVVQAVPSIAQRRQRPETLGLAAVQLDEIAKWHETRVVSDASQKRQQRTLLRSVANSIFSRQYKCVFVRTSSDLPTAAGEAMQPSASWLLASTFHSRPASMTKPPPSSLKK